jgi:hypothetical protein
MAEEAMAAAEEAASFRKPTRACEENREARGTLPNEEKPKAHRKYVHTTMYGVF